MGIRYMMDAAERLPIDIRFMLPSCVPATALEDNGACLTAEELRPFLASPQVLGLGEMMDMAGVLAGDEKVWQKLALVETVGLVDGHAPQLAAKDLMAYAAAGILSDHECVTPEEAEERLAAGMYLLIREGSAAHNLDALLPAVTLENSSFCCFCTDDRHPGDLLEAGGINAMVRQAVAKGIPVSQALQMATVNTARYFGLKDCGLGCLCRYMRRAVWLLSRASLWNHSGRTMPRRWCRSGWRIPCGWQPMMAFRWRCQ